MALKEKAMLYTRSQIRTTVKEPVTKKRNNLLFSEAQVTNEVDKYLADASVHREKPLKYWKFNKEQYPQLGMVICKLHIEFTWLDLN